MTTSTPSGDTRIYFDFGPLHEFNGGPGKPTFTPGRFKYIREQYASFMDPTNGCAMIETPFGNTIKMTRGQESTNPEDAGSYMVTWEHTQLGKVQLKVAPRDEFYIDTNSVFTLAYQTPIELEDVVKKAPGCSKEDQLKLDKMEGECVFPIRFRPYESRSETYKERPSNENIKKWTEDWKESKVHNDLVRALQTHAKDMRRVDRIVCFGLGPMNQVVYTSYIQHLAACTIAKTISEVQSSGGKASDPPIMIFAQDLFYTHQARVAMGNLDPPITAIDFHTNEALQMVNPHTFLITIGATAEIVEPALDIVGPEGLAGMLCDKMSFNGEMELDRKEFPLAKGRSPSVRGAASEITWQYRMKCICEPVTDDKYFGQPKHIDYERMKRVVLDDDGNIRFIHTIGKDGKKVMNVMWSIPENVPRVDKNGDVVWFDPATELLLRKK